MKIRTLGAIALVLITLCMPAMAEETAETTIAPAAYTPGVYTQVVRGMGGKMTFEITFSDSAITAIEATKHHETVGLGDRAMDAVIPAILETQSTDVDIWAGATITSNAIIKAVEAAMEEAAVTSAAVSYVPGVYTVQVRGMGGKMTFEITFSDSAITAIEATKHHETVGLGDRAMDAVIPAILETQSTDVDVWAGATITSNAIIKAVEEAQAQALVP